MRLLIRARNREVAVEDGRIVAPTGGFDLVLTFPRADVAPGLINAHDHLHRNHYGRLGRPPYPNAYAWAADIQAREAERIAEGRTRRRREALLEGAWKNLFCGVTTVVHHDPWEADFEDGFPTEGGPGAQRRFARHGLGPSRAGRIRPVLPAPGGRRRRPRGRRGRRTGRARVAGAGPDRRARRGHGRGRRDPLPHVRRRPGLVPQLQPLPVRPDRPAVAARRGDRRPARQRFSADRGRRPAGRDPLRPGAGRPGRRAAGRRGGRGSPPDASALPSLPWRPAPKPI